MTRERQFWIWMGGLVLFFVILYFLRSVLLPFVAAAAVAYFLDPVADRLERAGCSRTWATVLITLGFIGLMILAFMLLVPMLQSQIFRFVDQLPGLIQGLVTTLQTILQEASETFGPDRMAKLSESLQGFSGDVATWLVGFLRDVISSGAALVNLLSILFITPVITFYLLRDWDRMVETIDGWLPRKQAPTIRMLAKEIDQTIAGFVRGQATVCLALGTFYAIGLSFAGLELGLIVGLVSGLLSFIPYVGTIVGFVASMGLAVAQYSDWQSIAGVAAIFVAGQMIEGNYLTPKLVGDRIGLHAVWVIFALMVGASLFGFLGVLLAVPTAAVIGVLTRFALKNYLAGPLYSGLIPMGPGGGLPDLGAGAGQAVSSDQANPESAEGQMEVTSAAPPESASVAPEDPDTKPVSKD